MRRQVSTEQIASRRSDWDRQVKHPKNSSAHVFVEKVGDKRGGDCDEGRFTNTNQRVPDQKFGVIMRYGREQSEATPKKCSQNNNEFARVPISQRPDKRRGDHVEPEKRAGQVADLLFGNVKLILHQRLDREQHVAVRVVEQIERRQNNEGSFRLKIVPGHGSSEYNTG